MLVVLDRPHGNGDPGAVSGYLSEEAMTSVIVDIVRAKLTTGCVVDVQVAPQTESLEARAEFANEAGANLFLSPHINAGGGTGFESHVYPVVGDKTLSLATSIHKTMAAFYGAHGFTDRGLKRSNFAVLRGSRVPAVLLENLFMDNPEDLDFLKLNLYAIGNEIAFAISQALGLQSRSELACENCKPLRDAREEYRVAKQLLGEFAIRAASYVIK